MGYVNNLSTRQYIDGQWVEASNNATRNIVNPYNREVILTVPEGTEKMQLKLFKQLKMLLNLVCGLMKQVKIDVKSKRNR